MLKAINPLTWVNKVVDKRIQQYGKGVGTEMQYNPLLVNLGNRNSDKHLTRRILENSVWYAGIEQDIAYFYKVEAPKFYRKNESSESMNYFWANSNLDVRRIHSGFPQLICEKMADLIVGNGYNVKVESEDGTNEIELQEELDDILEDNKFKSMLFPKSIETESWSGGVSLKLSWNPKLTEYPIIEMWQPENYTNVVVAGRIVEDIFYTYYEKGNTRYRLSEMYGVDKTKGSYIDYKLERLVYLKDGQASAGSKWIPCSLKELDQTSELKRVEFNGYYKRLSLYKPNKLPNSEFRHSVIGESDYSGSYAAFDAVDEIISTWIQEHRDSKLMRYFPEEYMLKNLSTGEYNYPKDFVNKHILYADSPSENVEKQKIQYSQGDLRTEKHVESYKIWVTQILNNAGLSPLTVGLTGLESIDASAESQQEREKVSIRTRNKKIELWTEFLEDFLKTVLEFRLMTKNMSEKESNIYSVDPNKDFSIIVSFNDYILKSKRDRTDEVTAGLGTSWDVLTGVKYVHDDMTVREQLALSARLKLEQGYNSISQAELSALQAENNDANDMLAEEDVDIVPVSGTPNGVPNETEEVTPTEETPVE